MSDEAAARAFYEDHLGIGIGSQFLAVAFDALFAGVVICQLTHWIPESSHDPRHIQLIVVFGALAAIATTAFTWGNYFGVFVTHYGEYSRFSSFEFLGWYSILDMFTVIPVQSYFTERSIKLNNFSPPLIGLTTTLILGTMTCAIGVTISTRGHTVLNSTETIRGLLLAWPAVCTVTHAVLTGSILFALVRTRRLGAGEHGKENREANTVIDRLIMISIESQLPATLFALAALTILGSHPTSGIIPWIIIVHPKIFMVGCLASVNSRHTWRRENKFQFGSSDRGGDKRVEGSGERVGTSSVPTVSSSSGSGSQHTDEIPLTPKLGLARLSSTNTGKTNITTTTDERDLESGYAHELSRFDLPGIRLRGDDDAEEEEDAKFEMAVSAVSLSEPYGRSK